ncbi:hypothetical protein KUCAC02_003335, partial [Chaenocephalus aceratus]
VDDAMLMFDKTTNRHREDFPKTGFLPAPQCGGISRAHMPNVGAEDTHCKQSPSQRRTPHTISLAFKGVEYGQLCWRLNSLKPPFLLQRFIV